MGALTVASLTAKAQFTVDGHASAAEIGTGMGKYQLAATYTGNHLEADRGLSALYVGYTATTLNFMLVGSAESAAASYRALVAAITDGETSTVGLDAKQAEDLIIGLDLIRSEAPVDAGDSF